MYTFICNNFLHLFLTVTQLYFINFTCGEPGSRSLDGQPVNWPVAVKPERQVCKTLARGTRQVVDGVRVKWAIYILFIFINFFINFVFLICIFYQIYCLY
jgi:hypothetical protein